MSEFEKITRTIRHFEYLPVLGLKSVTDPVSLDQVTHSHMRGVDQEGRRFVAFKLVDMCSGEERVEVLYEDGDAVRSTGDWIYPAYAPKELIPYRLYLLQHPATYHMGVLKIEQCPSHKEAVLLAQKLKRPGRHVYEVSEGETTVMHEVGCISEYGPGIDHSAIESAIAKRKYNR